MVMSVASEYDWSSGDEPEQNLGSSLRLHQPYHVESSVQVLDRLTPEGDIPGTSAYNFSEVTLEHSGPAFSSSFLSSWFTSDDQYYASQSEEFDSDSCDTFDEMIASEWAIDYSRSDEHASGGMSIFISEASVTLYLLHDCDF